MPSPDLDLRRTSTLLCDADGTLFPSEEPAFDASSAVVNRCLERLGVDARYSAEQLRLLSTGKSFRASITDLARSHGVPVDAEPFRTALEDWVVEENAAVTAHLAAVLRPDPGVLGPLQELADGYGLAVVTSSALSRIDASLQSSGLAGFFPDSRRVSAQDSLPVPTSKPDPAVYLLALETLGVDAATALAVEDAEPGVRSAVAAGIPTVGILCFVPPPEREQRALDLRAAGAGALVDSWVDLAALLKQARAGQEAGLSSAAPAGDLSGSGAGS